MTGPSEEQFRIGLLAVQQGLLEHSVLLDAVRDWFKDEQRALVDVLLAQANLADKEALAAFFISYTVELSPSRLVSDEDIARVQQLLIEADKDRSGAHEGEATTTQQFDSASWAKARSNQGESNRFRIISQHAKGGLGVIFKAEDLQLHRTVALKQIQGAGAQLSGVHEKFYLEAEVTGQLEHPGIVPVYALGIDDRNRPFYAMRFIRGDDLRTHINELHAAKTSHLAGLDGLSLRQLLRRFLDVCNAVEYAHARGVLHRDLKPANIMLGAHGETLVVDWGLAKVMKNVVSDAELRLEEEESRNPGVVKLSGSGGQTMDGSFGGTPAYAPPEQLAGKIELLCPQSDVYSLGTILYQLLTGVPPISGKVNAIADLIGLIQKDLIPRPTAIRRGVPRPLEAICRKAMSSEISARYATAKELATDVEFWLADECVLAYRGHEPLIEQAGRLLRRYRSWTVSVGSSLVVIALLSVIAGVLVNRARLNERQAKESAVEMKTYALVRDRMYRDTVDTMLLHSGSSIEELPTVQDLQQRLLQMAMTDHEKLSENATQDPELEIENVRALVRMADILHLQHKYEDSYQQYQKAVSILDARGAGKARMNKDGPWTDIELAREIELGRVFSRMGLAYDNEGNISQARAEFERATELYHALEPYHSKSGPLLGNLAVVNANRGSLEQRAGNAQAATTYLRESLPLFAKALESGESRFELASMRAAESLARTLRDLGQRNASDQLYDDTLKAVDNWIAIEPNNSDYRETKASLHVSRAVSARIHGELKLATKELESATDVYQELSRDWPFNLGYQESLPLTKVDLGLVLLDQGQINSAFEKLEDAAKQFLELSESYPKVQRFRFHLATAYSGIGQALSEQELSGARASDAFSDSIRIGEELAMPYVENGNLKNAIPYLELVATTKCQYAKLLHFHDETTKARQLLAEAVSIFEAIVAKHDATPETKNRLAHAYWRRGLLEFDDQQSDTALLFFSKGIEQWTALAVDAVNPMVAFELANGYLQCPDASLNDDALALKYSQTCFGKVPENHSFATAYAEAAIRNGKIELSSRILQQIQETHGSWNASDYVVQSQIMRSENQEAESQQAIERAKEWVAANRPMNLDIQRQIKRASVARHSVP